jgi:hypothetical protein
VTAGQPKGNHIQPDCSVNQRLLNSETSAVQISSFWLANLALHKEDLGNLEEERRCWQMSVVASCFSSHHRTIDTIINSHYFLVTIGIDSCVGVSSKCNLSQKKIGILMLLLVCELLWTNCK